MIDDREIVVRLLLAAALGGALGLERELKDHVAGLRTHILVAIGACLFTLVGELGFAETRHAAPATDVSRIASQVVVGIGFLGAGTILRHGGTVRGLTTAASLWVTAAVGLAVGAGSKTAGSVTAAIAFIVLFALKPVERALFRRRQERGEEPEDV